jgi:hypothetical protein
VSPLLCMYSCFSGFLSSGLPQSINIFSSFIAHSCYCEAEVTDHGGILEAVVRELQHRQGKRE